MTEARVRKPGEKRIYTYLLVVFFIILAAIFMIPIASMVLTSLKPSNKLISEGFNLTITKELFTMENYNYLFTGNHNFFIWFKNSILVTIIQTVITLFVSAWVAYGFAAYRFKFGGFLFVLVLVVMMIPFEIIMLPLYLQMVDLKLTNSYLGLILPFIANGTTIFFFRQYLRGIPGDITDAGRIDGLNEYNIFLRLIMPLMKPAIAAMAILVGMNSWNNYLWPLLALNDSKLFTLPIGLNSLISIQGNNNDSYKVLLSGAVISILPILILFFSAQKYFISGMTTGSVKG